jgi:hypothetical protein
MGENKVYNIRKRLANGDEVNMTDSHSEVLELKQLNIAQAMVDVLNANTDSGCSYRVIPIEGDISELFEDGYPEIHD